MVENKTIGYAGMAFHTLTEVSKSYSQAKSTVQTTQLLSESLNKSLYLYSEIVVYDLLVKTNQLRGYDTFTCPSLATLVKVDQEDGTEYIKTLRYFLKITRIPPIRRRPCSCTEIRLITGSIKFAT